MADSKTAVGKPDRDRVNVHEDYELNDWAEKWNVSKEAVKKAVERVGPMAKDVQKELGK